MSKALFATINIRKNQLRMSGEDYRDLLKRTTGKTSLREMSHDQLRLVSNRLSAGAQPKKKLLTGHYAKLLQALWLSGWNLGVVKNKSDKALLAFVKRQTGIERTEFLRDSADSLKVIEAIKAMLVREAGVEWTPDRFSPDYAKHPRYRVLVAQLDQLVKLSALPNTAEHRSACIGNADLSQMSDEAWIEMQSLLGVRIRGMQLHGTRGKLVRDE